VVSHKSGQTGGARDDVRLTRRELAVLRLLAAGNSNREIGDALAISDGTVKIHVTNLFAKLGVTSARKRSPRPAAGTRAID